MTRFVGSVCSSASLLCSLLFPHGSPWFALLPDIQSTDCVFLGFYSECSWSLLLPFLEMEWIHWALTSGSISLLDIRELLLYSVKRLIIISHCSKMNDYLITLTLIYLVSRLPRRIRVLVFINCMHCCKYVARPWPLCALERGSPLGWCRHILLLLFAAASAALIVLRPLRYAK